MMSFIMAANPSLQSCEQGADASSLLDFSYQQPSFAAAPALIAARCSMQVCKMMKEPPLSRERPRPVRLVVLPWRLLLLLQHSS